MTVKYVNAYEVGRCYGGPEEGGWWYDAGNPLASIPCRTEEEIEAAKKLLHDIFDEEYNKNGRYSVIGTDDLVVYVEDDFAAPFPAERPHYE